MKIEDYELEDSILAIYNTLPPKSQHVFLTLLAGKTTLTHQVRNKNYHKSSGNYEDMEWLILAINLYKTHRDLQKED